MVLAAPDRPAVGHPPCVDSVVRFYGSAAAGRPTGGRLGSWPSTLEDDTAGAGRRRRRHAASVSGGALNNMLS